MRLSDYLKKNNSSRPDITSDFNSTPSKSQTNDLLQKGVVESISTFHALILAECNAYIEKMDSMDINDFSQKKKMLEELNMTNSLAYKKIIENEKKLKEKETLTKFKSLFPKSIFMAWDDFKSLVIKYGLVCGTTDKYLGDIPEQNLKEMMDAKLIIRQSRDIISDEINNGIVSIEYITLFLRGETAKDSYKNIDAVSYIKNFRFYNIKNPPFAGIYTNNEKGKYYQCYVTEVDINMYISAYDNHSSTEDFLIAASPDLMKELNESKIESPISSIKDDPIIFQILPNDIVMIHSKWGEESKDKSFQKNRI